MTFPPRIWKPIAWGLCILNVAGVAFAASSGEAVHATTHAALGVLFGLWALRMQGGPAPITDTKSEARLDALEREMDGLRQELAETQERLDFAERVLSQQRADRLEPPK